ncbi:DNA methylase [Verrucomicrobia bacterium LW23]|nr:DNA methylase [Verrucomicrobia bacterium LW23]
MTLPSPFWSDDATTLYQGDSLRILQTLPTASVDAVVTDPPYSSGGMTTGARQAQTSTKYVLTGTKVQRPEFCGDNRDQRSFTLWASLWLAECLRVTRPGGVLLSFIAWRQLPSMTDAVQVGGWIWRGIVPWDKTEGVRPQMGFFRAQCEYIITATHGPMGNQGRTRRICMPGCFRESVHSREKLHITGKPVELMKRLLDILPAGSVVLDPFAGSGTTLVAARANGMHSIGVEMSDEYCAIARDRLAGSPRHVDSPASA